MLVISSSPAPAAAIRSAQATASRPVGRRPPWVNTSQPRAGSSAARRLASIATTMHCAPKRRAASRTSSGSATAAVLMETLSAPARSSTRTSSTWRTPPPTVSGMKQRSAARDHVEQDRPRLVRGGDVEEAELVGSLGVVAPRHLDRIARIREVDEAHALDDAAVAHVEAGNDAAGEHQPPAAASASASRTAPV